MAGVKGRSGGRRSAAGTKSAATEAYQGTLRAQFEACVTPDQWRGVIAKALEQATNGDATARAWLTPWLVGAEPKEVKVSADGTLDVTIRYTDETPVH